MERTRDLLRKLAASERIRESGAESIGEAADEVPADAVPTRPHELLDRADANIQKFAAQQEERIADPADWQRAREIFLQHTGAMLRRAVEGDISVPSDAFAAEAVIIADGTRPSFLLGNGKVSATDPFMGDWGGQVAVAEAAGIARLAAAVGRIQPAGGHAKRFVGTGSLIGIDPADGAGIVLTNKHVIDDAKPMFGVGITQQGDVWRVDGPLEIDFNGESIALDTNRFRIVEVRFPVDAGAVFAGIDAAIARIAPIDTTSVLPQPVAIMSSDPAYANGALSSLATVGFPAEPTPNDPTVDWEFVLRTLFANRFGVKRLAPGLFTEALGSHPDDIGHRAIGHDATTFGGASGSLVTAWVDGSTPAFALHFGGQTRASNYAVSFAKERAALEAVGVRFA